MKQLMIHVERIVRPVRARQSRKLRMRHELLGHLQTALEEERGKTADEAAAIEQAKQRLGDPVELTRDLRRSVPLTERILLAKITPEKFNRWEQRAGRHMGLYTPITFAHWLLWFSSYAVMIFLICFFSPRVPKECVPRFFDGEIDHPIQTNMVMGIVLLLQYFWAFMGMRFLVIAAPPAFSPARLIRNGFLFLVTQSLLLVVMITQVLQRSPTVAEMAKSLGVATLLLGAGVFVGRGLAALRRPYDEWLTLDISA